MKNIFTTTLLALSINAAAQAPSIQWAQSFGGVEYETANAVKQTADGGFIVVGYTNSADGDVTGFHDTNPGTGQHDIWVVKLNSAGAKQWAKALGQFGDDRGNCVVQTTDGGYIVGGHSDFSSTHAYYNIYKLDDTGAITWNKTYGGSTDEFATTIRQTNDGGYVVAGQSYSTDGDVTGHHGGDSTSDVWVVKLDDTGKLEWQKSLGGVQSELAGEIRQTADGGYIIAGSSQSNDGDVTGHHGNSCINAGYCNDYWIAKLDNAGSLQWQKSYGGTDNDEGKSIQQTGDGGYIVAGSAKSNDGDVTGTHPGPVVATPDYWILKLDSTGGLQWQKTIGGTYNDIAKAIESTPDGGYIVAGSSNSMNGDVTGNHGAAGQDDIWMAKLNSTGGIQWEHSYGGTGVDRNGSMQMTSDGGFIMAGSSGLNDGDVSGNHGGADFWVVKLAAPSAVYNVNNDKSISVYPMPANDAVTIRTVSKGVGMSYTITDVAGRSVLDGKLSGATTVVDIRGLVKGFYMLQLADAVQAFKIIKQ